MLIALTALMLLLANPLYASPTLLENIYTNPEHQKLPEVIILYNSENSCENCNKAIDMTIRVLKENYRHKLHAYLINIAKHPEFATEFNTHAPLTLVVIRISDGTAFGYNKLTGLQSQTDDFEDFNRRITEFINNFLGWD